jgi:hypothetical protein
LLLFNFFGCGCPSCVFAVPFPRIAHSWQNFSSLPRMARITRIKAESRTVVLQHQFPIREIREIRGGFLLAAAPSRCAPGGQVTSGSVLPRQGLASLR